MSCTPSHNYHRESVICEETKLPVIKYKDAIWVKANTVANILRYKNTMKSTQGHVDPEDKKNCQNWGPNPDITIKGTRKTRFI